MAENKETHTPEYVPVIVLENIECSACKRAFKPNVRAAYFTVDEIVAKCKELHRDGVNANNILCLQPSLIIGVSNSIVPSAMMVAARAVKP